MAYSEVDFGGIQNAAGLTKQESELLARLVDVFNDRLANNRTRMDYYEDKNRLKAIGLTIPGDIAAKVNPKVGFAAKAVDYIAMRSQFDSITGNQEVADRVNAILNANDFAVEFSKAVPTELIHGCGFWTVSKGGAGEPAAVVNYHNATSAAALWNFRKKRILAGFVVEDYELVTTLGKEQYRPSFVVMHTDDAVIELARINGFWEAVRKPHMLGRPMMVPMCNLPSDTKPFGKSRISRSVMSIQDEMQRLLLRLSIHSEVFSSGQKAILGVSDEQFDALQGQKFRAAMSEMLLITPNENGENPQISAFAQQSPEPIISAIQLQMSMMAAETGVPVAEFGLSSNGYTSSEALRASSDTAILIAEQLGRNNGKAIVEVAKLALAIATNRTLDELTDEERAIAVHWIDPSMPSAASVADATSKLAGVVPEFGGTEIFWELNGFNEEQRRRVKADMAANQQRVIAASVFGA